MVDYKRILKLSSENYSLRQIAASVGHSHHTVKDVLELAQKRGITHPLDDSVTNADLEKLLYPERQTTGKHYAEPDYEYIHRELSKKA